MEFESLNDIIDYAIQREIEAAEFYETAFKEESLSGTKEMLAEFAGQERKHQKLLEKFKTQGLDDSVKSYKLKWIKDIKRSNFAVDLEYRP